MLIAFIVILRWLWLLCKTFPEEYLVKMCKKFFPRVRNTRISCNQEIKLKAISKSGAKTVQCSLLPGCFNSIARYRIKLLAKFSLRKSNWLSHEPSLFYNFLQGSIKTGYRQNFYKSIIKRFIHRVVSYGLIYVCARNYFSFYFYTHSSLLYNFVACCNTF